MKLKIDKEQAVSEAKTLIKGLQELENNYLFSQLHYADHQLIKADIGFSLRSAIKHATDLVLTLEKQQTGEVVNMGLVSRAKAMLL